jgi:hypothetical protein
LAQLHFELLSNAHSKRDILEALDALPKGIQETYDEIMKRINRQHDKDAELARRILGWITYAKEPLTTKQLQQALTITTGSTKSDEDAEIHEQILISTCLGIVTIDSKSNVIRLVHYTTQEYIERIRETQFPEAQAVIAKSCLTCLGFDMFMEGPPPGKSTKSWMSERCLFTSYASLFWAEHVNDMGNRLDVQEVAFSVLTDERKREVVFSIDESWENGEGRTLLHALAFYGLAAMFRIVLSGTQNVRGRYCSRPLWFNIG